MSIEAKTMYVADDGSYWETKADAQIRNEKIAAKSANEVEEILNSISFGTTSISADVTAYSIDKPSTMLKSKDINGFATLLENNVVRIENVDETFRDLCVKHNVHADILSMVEKMRERRISKATFYKVNSVWYYTEELVEKCLDLSYSIRTTDNKY